MESVKDSRFPATNAKTDLSDNKFREFVFGKVRAMRGFSISMPTGISWLCLFFLLVEVTSAFQDESRPNKWKGKQSRSSNWSQISRTQVPDVSSPLHVAQCRATCLQKFNNRGDGAPAFSCSQQTDCFTCWKSCELLESTWKSRAAKVGLSRSEPMCLHPRLCLSGCQVACAFYQEQDARPGANAAHPVIPNSRENVLQFLDGKIQWPRKPNQPDLVFVVIQQYPDLKWRQITQTTLSEVDVPRGLISGKSSKLQAVCVLVVSPQGLVTIYYPEPPASTQEPILQKESASLQETTVPLADQSPRPTEPKEEQSLMSHDWDLRKISLIHQKFLVIAELTWNHLPGAKDYLITWELDGGGLKGHLVTDSTTVSLSLWPDTVYHIQVELFGEETSSLHKKSLPVAVDTSEAAFPLEQPLALSKEASHKSLTQFLNVTLLVTVSAALLVLTTLGLALLVWTKCAAKRSRDPQLLQHMENGVDNAPENTSHKELKYPGVALISSTQSVFPNPPLPQPYYPFHEPASSATRSAWPLPFSSQNQPYFPPT